ncbi:hypothetical protein V6Z11_D10G301400 [Gossypium hirsutum]|uniref:Uncharacterized protein n=2 Tax=Gossypium TaxID=3633 RepID=A0A5D2JBS6_GOSTO|nr:hypothetical protein ES332_D10G322400v1 [Gossypium tomentosum]
MNNLYFNLSPPDISPAIKLHRFVCWVLAQIDSRSERFKSDRVSGLVSVKRAVASAPKV